uniref:Thrombomodulin n=1 Tax=Knipowitschia caucasica TaxID=637954 RepID=A0AAV2K8A4_KNICA
MMLLSKRALPLCVLFLCAASEGPSGHCAGTKCYALFIESVNSTEAERRCVNTMGQLYKEGQQEPLKLPVTDGRVWIANTDAAAGCSVFSSGFVEMTSCADELDGFFCQYTQICGPLLSSESVYINYTTDWSFEVQPMYPPGTLAEVRGPDQPPISKHICTGTEWMRAPWNCEVKKGGCEHACVNPHVCTCPAGYSLHHNKLTCTKDPCAKCTHGCVNQDGEWRCSCPEGFRWQPEGHCKDVNECLENATLCSGPGEECENDEGSYKCICKDEYDRVDGVCVESICYKCEHECDEVLGKLVCVCKKGYRVHPKDPTKCEEFCPEQDCPAKCVSSNQCYCPDGYILDHRDQETVCTDIDECEEERCDHFCYNTFGGHICECEEGFELQQDGYSCKLTEPIRVLGRAQPTLAFAHPSVVPPYVKTGSILGITVFALLCAALLFYLLQRLFIHCTKVSFYSLKREMEIFTLQQVSTETYKQLSHDWQSRNDCHRL